MNINSSLTSELESKEYRDAYVRSQIKVNLPFQIRALRNERGLSQGDLASLATMSQPRVSEIEKPGGRSLNLETLQRVASGLDVGLQVRFVSFGELVGWSEAFDPDDFHVPSFPDEIAALGGPASRVSASDAAHMTLEENGPAGDDSREAAGSEVFNPNLMPCVAIPETNPAGGAQLSR